MFVVGVYCLLLLIVVERAVLFVGTLLVSVPCLLCVLRVDCLLYESL